MQVAPLQAHATPFVPEIRVVRMPAKILITGSSGLLGRALVAALDDRYEVVGLDRTGGDAGCEEIQVDLTSAASIRDALAEFRQRHGSEIAAVLHLAAYYDFTGEPNPLYTSLNVEGTRMLLEALSDFDVRQIVYPSTMLVHAPGRPGVPIDETTRIAPAWVYPESKAAAEDAIRRHRGDTPTVILRFAGVYSDTGGVPTLVHQIQRAYERTLKSHVYAGDASRGQAMVHIDDVVDAFERTIERRDRLPSYAEILIGEDSTLSYEAQQQIIMRNLHGEAASIVEVPPTLAKAGAWVEQRMEPVVPDAIDQGEKPFIRPFMIDLAGDHYELDVSRARELLDWRPRHRIADVLPSICQALLDDPLAWYRANKLTPPPWLAQLANARESPAQPTDALRRRYVASYRAAHGQTRWAHFVNLGLGAWLIAAPVTHGYSMTPLTVSTIASGAIVCVLALLSLSWQLPAARWAAAGIGIWVMAAPLVFWAPEAAAYLEGTLIGALIVGFAVGVRPAPGVAPVAALDPTVIPRGWDFSPSTWTQRAPIIALAFVGLFISRYLAAYQLEHIDGIFEPFFAGSSAGRNGTEQIITSSVSRAWPVPDAGLGALTYMLEILTGLIGSAKRWRTMPWLVMAFGIMIVPLGAVSIFFIVIQPIVIGTWCTLCLVAAAAMILQIPYSLDELAATTQFLWRRHRAGRSLSRIFFVGDSDNDTDARTATAEPTDEFDRTPVRVVKDAIGGGVNVPWNLAASAAIGAFLMLTRLTVGSEPPMAHGDHLIGALVVTVSVTAFAEIARPLRFLNALLGAALIATPFMLDGGGSASTVTNLIAGLALIALAWPRGRVRNSYGELDRYLL